MKLAGDAGPGWVGHPAYEMKESEFVSNMEIFENAEVLSLLAETSREIAAAIDECAPGWPRAVLRDSHCS